MIYCPECGSQVANIDVFCPYCGISLPPPAPPAIAEDEEEFANTIAINPLEISSAAENPAAELKESGNAASLPTKETAHQTVEDEKSESEISETNQKQFGAEESSGNQTGAYSFTPTAANIDWKTESVDIPADVFGNQNENRKISAESVPVIENKTDFGAEPSLAANQTNEDGKENIIESKMMPQEYSISGKAESESETNLKEGVDETRQSQIDLPDRTEEAFLESAGNIDSSAGDEDAKIFSQPVADSEENKVEAIDKPNLPLEEISGMSSNPDDTETMLQPEQISVKEELLSNSPREIQEAFFSDAKQNLSDADPIGKPDLELPAPPINQSVFDSVQIVQKEEKREPIEPNVNQAAVEPEPQKESRPYTSPNIGAGGDTDGRGGSSKLKPLDEGTVLNGRYEIVRKIGGGGMGAVYLASDKNLGGVLRAVKEMVQSYIEETQQEKAIADFKRESMLLTSLDHPSIPTIYDYFYDEKEARFYLVMKYISGGDLASRLRAANEGKIDEKSVTEWAIQIADVLDYLHNRQPPIVYRDLKPANIMIDGNSGRVMLIDFGIARWINKEEKGVTAVGTMGYAPPELFSGNVESRSDIYSLGSTIFHLLTGADPQSNPLLIFDFQKNPHPRQINPQLSDQMERILMRSVEYNAEKRFASAAEMRQALEEHLANLKANKVTFGVKQTPASVALSEEPVFCGFCGQRIIATDMFCAFCGAKQPIAQQGVHQPAAVGFKAQQLTARLMIVGTNELDAPMFSLDKDNNLVGRRDPMSNIFPEVDLSKFDPQTKISRRHARIWRDGSQYMVEDLGSSNGTVLLPVLNETVRLSPHQPHVLTNGDKLKLGDTTMHFIVG